MNYRKISSGAFSITRMKTQKIEKAKTHKSLDF